MIAILQNEYARRGRVLSTKQLNVTGVMQELRNMQQQQPDASKLYNSAMQAVMSQQAAAAPVAPAPQAPQQQPASSQARYRVFFNGGQWFAEDQQSALSNVLPPLDSNSQGWYEVQQTLRLDKTTSIFGTDTFSTKNKLVFLSIQQLSFVVFN